MGSSSFRRSCTCSFCCHRSLQSRSFLAGHLCMFSHWPDASIILPLLHSFLAGLRARLQVGAIRHTGSFKDLVQSTCVWYCCNARIMLPTSIAPHNIFCSQLNPCTHHAPVVWQQGSPAKAKLFLRFASPRLQSLPSQNRLTEAKACMPYIPRRHPINQYSGWH
jgi:hypothetical protein